MNSENNENWLLDNVQNQNKEYADAKYRTKHDKVTYVRDTCILSVK